MARESHSTSPGSSTQHAADDTGTESVHLKLRGRANGMTRLQYIISVAYEAASTAGLIEKPSRLNATYGAMVLHILT